jgi:hypothetical protein
MQAVRMVVPPICFLSARLKIAHTPNLAHCKTAHHRAKYKKYKNDHTNIISKISDGGNKAG